MPSRKVLTGPLWSRSGEARTTEYGSWLLTQTFSLDSLLPAPRSPSRSIQSTWTCRAEAICFFFSVPSAAEAGMPEGRSTV